MFFLILLASKPLIDEPEDKVLPRLGLTYGVLRWLGFSEERVDDSLTAISGVGLDEALDWVR